MKTIRFALIASVAFAATASTAFSAPVLRLTGDKTLVMFDTEKPAVTKTMDVTGVDKLVGIDYRPGNKTVIGVTRIIASSPSILKAALPPISRKWTRC